MITISLDEQGHFEDKDTKEPLFIAGVIFNDLGYDSEVVFERKRIVAYYKRAIFDAGKDFSYPEDLHSNGDKGRDRSIVRNVKASVRNTFGEFINYGTYNHEDLIDNNETLPKRRGQYHLFVILKSDIGKERLLEQRSNMFANDDWAANRYFHMAETVLNRIIFHNPLFSNKKMPSVSLDIATRSTGRIENSEKKDEYIKLGHDNNRDFFRVMNSDIYRTLIAQEMVNSGKTNVDIVSFQVRPIKYVVDCYTPIIKDMEFLYLSDSFCSIIGYQLSGNNSGDWLKSICSRVEYINPGTGNHNDLSIQNLIFGYDEIDNDFAKAWKYYENSDYFNAFSIIYKARKKKGEFVGFYNRKWFPYIKRLIHENISPVYFTKCVNELSDMLTINNLDKDKLLFIMKEFETISEKVKEKYESRDDWFRVMYKLYDAGVSAFCHIGDSKNAIMYYDKCKEYAFYIGLDSILRINNKLVVCLEDCFEWENAFKVAEEGVNIQKKVSALKRQILRYDNDEGFFEEAKAISQKARILAELRSPEAEKVFREALNIMEKGSANYKITQSYLLHFYADMGLQELYRSEAVDYFNNCYSYKDRLDYLLSENSSKYSSIISIEYAFYVLIRGLYLFDKDSIDTELWQRLKSFLNYYDKNSEKGTRDHPWEISYKYLTLIAYEKKDLEAQELYYRLRKKCLNHAGDIINALNIYGDAEIADIIGERENRDRKTIALSGFLKSHFDSLKMMDFSADGNKRYEELGKYFTFMYR